MLECSAAVLGPLKHADAVASIIPDWSEAAHWAIKVMTD